jgi:hypothetical protein
MLIEPWRSAWRLIEEFWKDQPRGHIDGVEQYDIQERLKAGERSGVAVRELVDLVAPRLHIENYSARTRGQFKKSFRPKQARDLFMMRLASGKAVDQSVLKLAEIADVDFLISLADGLEAAIVKGLEIAKRLGWKGDQELWRLGQLNRVYHVLTKDREEEDHEPDEFHEGISPSVKLLYAVIERLVDVDADAGVEFTQQWKSSTSPVFLRLWAAWARDPRLASPVEVASFLAASSDEVFWLVHYFPEVAELRALRFKDLSAEDQDRLIARIKKLPSRRIWPHFPAGNDLKRAKVLAAVRELTRIQVAGGNLRTDTEEWLRLKKEELPELEGAERVDDGFPTTSRAYWVKPDPDARFDTLAGETRLDAIAEALSLPRESWDNDPAQRAADWLQQPQAIAKILSDLEAAKATRRGADSLWERLGWAHSPQSVGADANLVQEAERVLLLLADLPDGVIASAVGGISHWLSSWQKQVVFSKLGRVVWARVWPIAVNATNARLPAEDQLDVNTVARSDRDRPMDLDTLNTPAGKLVGVFLAGCPDLEKVKKPFAQGRPIRSMRDLIMKSDGRSLLVAQHRMIDSLAYFLAADRRWAQRTLVALLVAHTPESAVLWRAVGRRIQFRDVMKELGTAMVERSTDLGLDRKTRQVLAQSLVVECLHALLEERSPVVQQSEVQQMLRAVDEEVRANVAAVFARFVGDVSSANGSALSRENIFRTSVAPFLKRVWPQETSLTTAGVSQAFAVLPAATREAFAETVGSIARFLVPFDAWSMINYGLYGEFEGTPKLHIVNDSRKAEAFLLLLDKTIGTGERAVVPHELGSALTHIRSIAPELEETSRYRRLAAMARR